LGTGQAKLACVTGDSPSGLILSQCAEPVCDTGLIQPFNFRRSGRSNGSESFWLHELDCARAVFAYIREQFKNVSGRNVKLSRPLSQDNFVVGEQAPKEGMAAA
jgi:hypothetical protein